MKKTLIIASISIVGLLMTLLVIPYFFKDSIVKKIKQSANSQVNAQVDFSEVNMSLLRHFPNISLTLNNLHVKNFEPFEGETLAAIDEVVIKFPISNLASLFSGKLSVNSFTITGCNLNLITNQQGVSNYDIAIKESTQNKESKNTEKEGSSDAILAVKEYQILKSNLKYCDYSSHIYLNLNDINHQGSGDFSVSNSKLKTNTTSLLSFNYNGFQYFSEKSLELEALLEIDLDKMRFGFLENQANLDELKMVLDGFVQMNEEDMMVDLSFNTPSSEFNNLFRVIPSDFQSYFDKVDALGNFTFDGAIKGIVDDKHIPTIDLNVKSENGSLKYKDLNSRVENIMIDVSVINKTGLSEDTKIDLKKLFFNIQDDRFEGNALVELFDSPRVSLGIETKLRLQNLYKAFHLVTLKDAKGTIDGEIRTSFDMKALENSRYDRTNSAGQIAISDFAYKSESMNSPLNINKAVFRIENEYSYLDKLKATTGKTDLSISGKLNNLLGYLFNNEDLKGDFELNSNNFVVDDFMSTAEEDEVAKKAPRGKVEIEQAKIPDYLNLTFKSKAKKASYGSIKLTNFEGILLVKNQKAVLKDISFGLFKGAINLNGEILTQSDTPTFDFALDAKNFDIAQSISQLNLFNTVAPISNFVEGTLNSSIKISGNLDKELSPITSSIKGNADSQLLSSRVHLDNNASFNKLASNFDFLDEKTIDLSNLKTYLSFDDGQVQVKPFELKYKDIPIKVSGSHGFDLSMNYDLKLDVPAVYFSEYLDGVVSLTEEEKKGMNVPINAKLTGSFKKPQVTTDTKAAIASLTSQIVKKKTSGYLEKGKKELLKLFR